MLRLLMKLSVTPFGLVAWFCNISVSILLWDERGGADRNRLLKIIWSDNEPIEMLDD